MSRRNLRGMSGLELVLLAVVLFFGLGLILLNQILLMSGVAVSKKNIDANMYVDDRGTELLSLMKSTNNGLSTMYITGALSADNYKDYLKDYLEMIEGRIDKASLSHDLVLSGETLAHYLGKETESKVPAYTETSAQKCGLNADPSHNIKLKWPSSGKHISSVFGYRKLNEKCNCHGGIDISGSDLDVYVAADGVVIEVYPDPDKGQSICREVGDCIKIYVEQCGCNGRHGNEMIIEHEFGGEKYRTYYYHLKAIDSNIRIGSSVKAGQLIAKTGNTGFSTGAHLHFELRGGLFDIDTNSINPCSLFETTEWTGDCVHAFPEVCKTFKVYGTYIPVPGARSDKLNTEVTLRAW